MAKLRRGLMRTLQLIVQLFLLCLLARGQQAAQSGCLLSMASNGQVITLQGKVIQEPHDLAFDVPGCKEMILLTFAGDQDNDVNASKLRRDENLKRFRRYTRSTYK